MGKMEGMGGDGMGEWVLDEGRRRRGRGRRRRCGVEVEAGCSSHNNVEARGACNWKQQRRSVSSTIYQVSPMYYTYVCLDLIASTLEIELLNIQLIAHQVFTLSHIPCHRISYPTSTHHEMDVVNIYIYIYINLCVCV